MRKNLMLVCLTVLLVLSSGVASSQTLRIRNGSPKKARTHRSTTKSAGVTHCSATSSDGKKSCSVSCKAGESAYCDGDETTARCICN